MSRYASAPMWCESCQKSCPSKVLESRRIADGVWRQRECLKCNGFTDTIELRIDKPSLDKIKSRINGTFGSTSRTSAKPRSNKQDRSEWSWQVANGARVASAIEKSGLVVLLSPLAIGASYAR